MTETPDQQPPLEPELDVEGHAMQAPDADNVGTDSAEVIDITGDPIDTPPAPTKTRH